MAVDGTTAEGMWKDVFGELENTVPEHAMLASDIPFKERAKLGKNYIFPVRLRRGHGVTLAGGSTAFTAFALNAVRSGQTDDASVQGSMYVGRESFAYKAVAAGLSGGKQAFTDVFADGVEDLYTTAGFYLEALLLYGQTSFGAFSEAGPNATTATLDISVASTAPGLLAQLEGAAIDVYSDTAFGTKRNSNALIGITGFAYDPGTGVGQLSLAGNASDIDAIAVGDVFVPVGAYNSGHMAFAGLDKILTTTSGSMFGIDTATYPVWAGTTYDVGSAAVTFLKMIKAGVSIATRCPYMNEAIKVYASPATWTDLNNNHAALRRMAESTKGSLDLGTKKITYYSNAGSSIEVVSHAMVKQGECFMGFPSLATRGGVSDITFNLNKETGQAERFLRELPDNAGFEIRVMWDQFLVLRKPKGWVKMINIVNSL
jgi:hypothetical protein